MKRILTIFGLFILGMFLFTRIDSIGFQIAFTIIWLNVIYVVSEMQVNDINDKYMKL